MSSINNQNMRGNNPANAQMGNPGFNPNMAMVNQGQFPNNQFPSTPTQPNPANASQHVSSMLRGVSHVTKSAPQIGNMNMGINMNQPNNNQIMRPPINANQMNPMNIMGTPNSSVQMQNRQGMGAPIYRPPQLGSHPNPNQMVPNNNMPNNMNTRGMTPPMQINPAPPNNSNQSNIPVTNQTDPDKRKMIQNQLIILIHAAKCQKRNDQNGQHCQIPHCQTMKARV